MKLISKISDFIIRVIMMFTTIIALLFFIKEYPDGQFMFGILTILFILAIMMKGLADIFSKEI